MFFTKIGRVLAYFVGFLALVRIVVAFLIAGCILPPEAQQQYLGARSIGEVIDRSAYILAGCIFLGILTEISLALRTKQELKRC